MIFTKFSKNQMKVFNWWTLDEYDAVIADGSIRSGKTLSMSVSFVLWAMCTYQNQTFAYCGKTIESLRRNVIVPLFSALEGLYTIRENKSQNYIEVTGNGVTNRFYLFGGKDESSYQLVQGITLAGVMFDEVALMPRSFVEQALARCSVAGSKFWFNCNPESPTHWFYLEWIQEHEKKNALYIHFTMNDNLSLDPKIKQRYENMYAGVFYDRYILGKWVKAEGLIYSMFDENKHITDDMPEDYIKYYISCDYGTQNPFAAHLWGKHGGKWYCIKEYYYNGRKEQCQLTDEEYYKKLEELAGNRFIQYVVVDPSAASFITCIRKHGKFRVRPADNAVEDGIRNVSTMLQAEIILFNKSCKETIQEFYSYVWDEKASERGEDKPVKENDHCMDSIRYFVQTIAKKKVNVR